MQPDIAACQISLFVSGHSHSPSLAEIRRTDASVAATVNTGCWLRQLQPVPAHFGGPPVFVPVFVQSHVRVSLRDAVVSVELWEKPRRPEQRLPLVERLAILGRRVGPDETGENRLVQRVELV
jgi:hypothetical protein